MSTRSYPYLFTTIPGALSSAAVNDGLALVAGGSGHRVDFTGAVDTTWTTIAPVITVSAGSLGAITVDSDTTAHATYTPGAGSGTTTFTATSHNNSTATLSVLAAATGYTLSGPSTGTTGAASTNFTIAVSPAGSAVESVVTVTPAVSPDGTVSGTVSLAARTADASGTFTVTAAADGAHTVSTSDNGGLTDPTSLTYTSGTPQYLEDAILNWFKGATFPAAPSTLYVGLHTGDPGKTGAHEVSTSGTAYARVSVTSSSGWSVIANGTANRRQIANAGAVTFPAPTGTNWGTVSHYGIWSASSGGSCVAARALNSSVIVNAGDTAPSFGVGALIVDSLATT